MRARSYRNMATMTAETAFAISAFGCGLFDAPMWTAGLAAISMLAYWSWTRGPVLDRLRGAAWATVAAVGATAIIAIQAGAYWLGLVTGGIL